MAYTKRTWLGRQGTGLNKFSIGGATPVTIVNQPDSVTQVGDALSAGNLNDLEDRIESAFDDVDTALDTKADEQDVTNLNNAINQLDHRVENLEQAKGDYVVSNYKDGSITPSGKGKWAVVEGVRGVSRCENQLIPDNKITYTFTVSQDITQDSWGSNFLALSYLAPYVGHTVLAFRKPHNDKFYVAYGNNAACFTTGRGIEYNDDLCGIYTLNNTFIQNSGALYIRYRAGLQAGTYSSEIYLRDLNVYFGTSDLSFLGATDSAKLATIQTNYPHLLLPSEYGTRIVDWTGNGVRAWGVNLFNPYAQQTTTYGTATISDDGDTISITGTYYCMFALSLPVGTYHVRWTAGSGSIHLFRFQFEDGSITESQSNITTLTVTKKITGLLLYCASGTSATSVYYDVQVAYDDSPAKATYHRYRDPNTLSFPSTSLKSAGSVAEMYFPESGEVTHPLGSYTFTGDEPWVRETAGNIYIFRWALTGKKVGLDNLMLAGYVTTNVGSSSAMPDKSVRGHASSATMILIRDDSFNDASSFAQSLIGKTVWFELATPNPDTYSDPILDNTLLTESGGRMATVQTGTVVDGSFDMGFITL